MTADLPQCLAELCVELRALTAELVALVEALHELGGTA